MRTPAQRGLYGRWLVASREARGYDTAEKALSALAAAGIKIGKSTYAEYESGTKTPSRNHLPLLEGFWGAPVETPAPSDSAALIAAIGELVQEMRASRVQQVESTDAVLRALAAVLPATQARPGTPDGSGNATPAGTGQ